MTLLKEVLIDIVKHNIYFDIDVHNNSIILNIVSKDTDNLPNDFFEKLDDSADFVEGYEGVTFYYYVGLSIAFWDNAEAYKNYSDYFSKKA